MSDIDAVLDFFNEDKQVRVKAREWMKDCVFVRVTPDNIAACIDHCLNGPTKRCAIDLETTGVDNRVFNNETVDKIVGVCLCPDGKTGYYIPLRHRDPDDPSNQSSHNVPWSVFDREFRRLIQAIENNEVVAVFHNGEFDQEFLEFNGGDPFGTWDKPSQWDDSLIEVYLHDSRRRNKKLKHLTKEEFQCDQIELDELFPPGHPKHKLDFSLLDPNREDVIWYGGGDGIFTYRLDEKYRPLIVGATAVPDQKGIYQIEKSCVAATRWMQRCRIKVNKDKVKELIVLAQTEWFESIQEVYRSASEILGRDVMPGYYKYLKEIFKADDPDDLIPNQIERAKGQYKVSYPDPVGKVRSVGADNQPKEYPLIYDVNAPAQLGLMFDEMKVPGLRLTDKSAEAKKTGITVDDKGRPIKLQIKTDRDEIERIIEEAGQGFPFMQKIRRFRETSKALSSYLIPMLEDIDPRDNTMRISFKAHKVDTGRFATPASEDRDKSRRMIGWPSINLQSLPATYDPNRPACMTRLRECIVARSPNKVIVAIDYSGVELRLVTNLSREPKWWDEYFRCSNCARTFNRGGGKTTPEPPPPRCPNCGSDKIGDLHTLTALEVYGQDAASRDDWKQLRQYAKCVHPDTLVGLFEEGCHAGVWPLGVLSFGDFDQFQPVQRVTMVWSGTQDVPVRSTYNGGVKALYHVVTRRGILTCSDQHAFVRADGSQTTISTGLTVGDVLAEPEAPCLNSSFWPSLKYRPFEGVPEVATTTSPALAYFAGLFLGDGAKGGTTTVGIAHGKVGQTDKTGTAYSQWQDLLVDSCEAAGFTPKRRAKSVYLGSRHVMRFLEVLSLVRGVAGGRILRVPLWVLQSGREGVLQFLGGLFDTDGTVNKLDAGIAWTTKDAIFAGQVAALLHALGVTPAVEPYWNKTHQRWYYRVHVRVSDAPAVAKYMRHPGKRARLRDATPGTRFPNMNMVLKVIPAGDMPCVDLNLDNEEHLYWTNGLLTHNSTNFALCYGGGGNAVVRATGCDKNEGWRTKDQFDKTYRGLHTWWSSMHKFARQNGYVLTAFGRKYPLPDILSADRGFRSKAERNAVNGPIQGSSADITKASMALIYKEVKKRGWLDKVLMIITMHDELVFEIDIDILEEAIEVLMHTMIRNPFILGMKWPVPLTSDVEIGYDWSVPWSLNEMRYKEVRFLGNKKLKKGKAPEGVDWNTLLSFPELLAPHFKYMDWNDLQRAIKAGVFGIYKPASGEQPPPPPDQPSSSTLPSVPHEAESTSAVAAVVSDQPIGPPAGLKAGGVYEHRIKAPLSLGTLSALADVIASCRGRGTRKLRLLAWDGTPLDGWEKHVGNATGDEGPVMVNENEFFYLASLKGI